MTVNKTKPTQLANQDSNAFLLYKDAWERLTGGTGNLALFADDQEFEHWKAVGKSDFWKRDAKSGKLQAFSVPRQMFEWAAAAGVPIAAHPAAFNDYLPDFPQTLGIVKLNGKSDFPKSDLKSALLSSVDGVLRLRERYDGILGVGFTVYPGDESEIALSEQAAYLFERAHAEGLITVLWCYPRGSGYDEVLSGLKDDEEKTLAKLTWLTNAVRYANSSIGADWVKVAEPDGITAEWIQHIVAQAGSTGVIFAGGGRKPEDKVDKFARQIVFQMNNGARGSATGRWAHNDPNPPAFLAMIKGVNAFDLSTEEAAVAAYGNACDLEAAWANRNAL